MIDNNYRFSIGVDVSVPCTISFFTIQPGNVSAPPISPASPLGVIFSIFVRLQPWSARRIDHLVAIYLRQSRNKMKILRVRDRLWCGSPVLSIGCSRNATARLDAVAILGFIFRYCTAGPVTENCMWKPQPSTPETTGQAINVHCTNPDTYTLHAANRNL